MRRKVCSSILPLRHPCARHGTRFSESYPSVGSFKWVTVLKGCQSSVGHHLLHGLVIGLQGFLLVVLLAHDGRICLTVRGTGGVEECVRQSLSLYSTQRIPLATSSAPQPIVARFYLPHCPRDSAVGPNVVHLRNCASSKNHCNCCAPLPCGTDRSPSFVRVCGRATHSLPGVPRTGVPGPTRVTHHLG